MARNAMNIFGRLLNSAKIKDDEARIREMYLEDYKDSSLEEEAIDCVKLQNDTINLIDNSSGTERMKYLIGLQALFNSKRKELDFAESMIQSMPTQEYKSKFSSAYDELLHRIGLEENLPWDDYIEMGKIANSKKIKNKNVWLHVLSCLYIYAIDERFGDVLNKTEENIRKI